MAAFGLGTGAVFGMAGTRIDVAARPQRAVKRGEWKLLKDGDDLLLYNLRTDVGERHDLAGQRPDLVAALLPLIGRWESDVDAGRTRPVR